MTNEELGEEIKRTAALLHQEAITIPPATDSKAYHALRESALIVVGFVKSADVIRAAHDANPDDYGSGPLVY